MRARRCCCRELTPASSHLWTGAMPEARRMLLEGQCAMPRPFALYSSQSASSRQQQCAYQASLLSHPTSLKHDTHEGDAFLSWAAVQGMNEVEARTQCPEQREHHTRRSCPMLVHPILELLRCR